MFAGDAKVLVITVRDAAGAAVNITGATITWEAARSTEDAAVITKTTSDGIEITDATHGVFEVTLDPADTDDLFGLYYHEAELTQTGDPFTVLTGSLVVERTLIRAS